MIVTGFLILFALVIVGFAVQIVRGKIDSYDIDNYDIADYSLWFFAIFVGFMSVIALIGVVVGEREISRTTNSSPIVSLNIGSENSGRFFLGSGGFGSERQYYFMEEIGDQQYKQKSLPISIVTIRETNEEDPNWSHDEIVSAVPGWLVPESWTFLHTIETTNNVLTIPEGSIIQEFSPN